MTPRQAVHNYVTILTLYKIPATLKAVIILRNISGSTHKIYWSVLQLRLVLYCTVLYCTMQYCALV